MPILRLKTVDAFVALDLENASPSAGGVRLAKDVSEEELSLLARAMTYKWAVLSMKVGGAKSGIRHDGGAGREDAVLRFCREIKSLVDEGHLMVGPDLGTSEADLAPVRKSGPPGPMGATVDGQPIEDLLTGFGVVCAMEAALGTLDGRTVAIEGFGKVGGGIAREAAKRGGRVVAFSTLEGCVARPEGFDVQELFALRKAHGDALVRHLGAPVLPTAALFEVKADALSPGARLGAINLERARRVDVRVIAPAANVPYQRGAVELLEARGVLALPDFVCNSAAVIGYRSPATATPTEVFALVRQRIGDLIRRSLSHPRGAYAGAAAIAEEFLRSWRPPTGLPPGPSYT